MKDEQLLRYSRHILLPQIDVAGQQALLSSHVLVVGLGGLGSPVALYLTAAGIGHLTLVDDDKVELSNLPRQILYGEHDIGNCKATSAAAKLHTLNSDCQIDVHTTRLTGNALYEDIVSADVVVDCSDNFATRFLLNEATQALHKPLVSGAAIRLEGQVTVYDARETENACYRCIYQDTGEIEQTCSETGVISPLLGIIGSIQAVETVKILTGIGETLAGRLMVLDASSMSWRTITLRQNPDCPVCNRATIKSIK